MTEATRTNEGATGEAPRATAPIFVVGCQRSGTTMLRLVLDSHPRISCGPETRFLAAMERITGADWERLSRFGFSEEEWLHRIATFFGGVQEDYARSRGKVRWADKTPLYALSLPFVTAVFPDSQIVHVIRDGRDVMVSHRKRFGYLAAVKCSVKWPRYIATARAAAEALPAERYLELRYEDLVASVEASMRTLMDFLGEEWDPSMLEYEQHEHDVAPVYTVEAAARRAGAATEGPIYSSQVGSYRRELDPLLRLLAWLFSRRTLRELGYR